MQTLHTAEENVSPSVAAALMLAAIPHLKANNLSHPTATEVIAATGASRSHAYELKARLDASLGEIARPPGRPPAPAVESGAATGPDIARQLLDYVYRHPGCIATGAERSHYSDGLRRFMLDLIAGHPDVSLDAVAQACGIPLGTLKDWQRGGNDDIEAEAKPSIADAKPRGPQIETVLVQWQQWQGSFTAFCEHVQIHYRIPFGSTLIARILEANGVRLPRRRPGRSPDEQALRGAFVTFFPHAQWVGDGTAVPVMVDDKLFVFNVEMNVDAYSGTFLGVDVSLVEDGEAVIETFRDAIAADDTRPIALLLDNKPSNHTEVVKAELGDTLLIRATPFRGQNKAHIEGGFGLLKPTLEGLELSASSRVTLAASYLRNLVITWARTINNRPRRDRGGRTRVQLLQEEPTPEQVQQAHAALQERVRRQEKARETQAARQNPIVRSTLADAYERLGLEDPDGHILGATARYPLDAVIEAVAIFEGRKRANTLPHDVDARYLLGIARNIAEEREGWEIALALWDARVQARDVIAQQLQQQRESIDDKTLMPIEVMKQLVDQALQTPSRLETFFWLSAAADVIAEQHDRRTAFRIAARRIAATHAVPHRHRLTATRFLAAKVLPT